MAKPLPPPRFTSITFRRYKAFAEFHLSLQEFNVLVGPNNAGKSTIIGALRILAEGIRRARARKAEAIDVRGHLGWGYRIDLEDLPIAGENVFFNYDDSQPAEIRFRVSNGNSLKLHFSEPGSCCLVCDSKRIAVRTPSDFEREFDVDIGFVPILGPVDHNEPLYKKEAARLALLSHDAARNFRNIWYHYPEDFVDFRDLIVKTWPGMDIQEPEVQVGPKGPLLRMFCPEERYPREMYWAGYGFQVWCQMLTYIVKARQSSLLIIDEPDIYLHSDLQRQLVSLLSELGPDILIATHSTEIVSEVDPSSLLVINKKHKSARQLKDVSQVKRVFAALGSNLNPILTQLAKTRRALFVEGGDFQILSSLARVLSKPDVANRSEFAVVPIEGFNPRRAVDLARGIEMTLDAKIAKAVVLDRDYRAPEEVQEIVRELEKDVDLVVVHERKELENYLLAPVAIERAISLRLKEKATRTAEPAKKCPDIPKLLDELSQPLKPEVAGQYLARRAEFLRKKTPGLDPATSNAQAMTLLEKEWGRLETRLAILPGKQVLALLNRKLQSLVGVSVSALQICNQVKASEIPSEMRDLIKTLGEFSKVPNE
jgi:energy-coupling factor transporter ATP-binding protein EcfA2